MSSDERELYRILFECKEAFTEILDEAYGDKDWDIVITAARGALEEFEEECYRYVGKLGPWARHGAEGVRYLATGSQQEPVYRRILSTEKDEGSWRYVRVWVEGEMDVHLCGCGTNIYEEVK